MSDDAPDPDEIRFHLQKVAAYRELCRVVARSGRENIVWALVMLSLVYVSGPPNQIIQWLIVGVLVGGELCAGLFKWLWPSAEGFLMDALVLLLFGAYNLFVAYLKFGGGQGFTIPVILGAFMLNGALGRYRAYGNLRKTFDQRPTSAHIAWFDELVYEIRHADPQLDELALDLPTKPHWKAKLLGSTAFFVLKKGTAVAILSPEEFVIIRDKEDSGTGVRKAFLQIQHRGFPEFAIDEATWSNYDKWRKSLAEQAAG